MTYSLGGQGDFVAGNIDAQGISQSDMRQRIIDSFGVMTHGNQRIVYDGAMRSGETTAANLLANQVLGQVLTREDLQQAMDNLRNTRPLVAPIYEWPVGPMTIEDPMNPSVNVPFDKRTKAERESDDERERKWARDRLSAQLSNTTTTAEYTPDNNVIIKVIDHQWNILHQRTAPIDYGKPEPSTDRVSLRCAMMVTWSSNKSEELENGQE